MRYEASRALRKRHDALRCVTERHDNDRHERHEGGIHDLAALSLLSIMVSYLFIYQTTNRPLMRV